MIGGEPLRADRVGWRMQQARLQVHCILQGRSCLNLGQCNTLNNDNNNSSTDMVGGV